MNNLEENLLRQLILSLKGEIAQLNVRIDNLRSALNVSHDTMMPEGRCIICDALIKDYENDNALLDSDFPLGLQD